MGKPVALEASAEERDTRGFISMMHTSPVAGFTANWMLEPPVSTPISRMTRMDRSRRCWYSRSVRVCAGATVMLSPVCTPIGSRFSMEQMMTTLSLRSRITSSSYSFQPSTDSSTSTWCTGEAASASRTMSSSCSRVRAMPPPAPPRVNDGRITRGSPSSSARSCTSARERAMWLRGTRMPSLVMASRNSSRSSALRMAATLAPMSSTPWRCSAPLSCKARARLSAVCPPIVGSRASGRSLAMTASSTSGVMGSM